MLGGFIKQNKMHLLCFFLMSPNARKRELAKIDETRRAGGTPNPMRDKNEGV